MIHIGDMTLYDVEDLEKLLELNIRTVRKMIGEGRIPAKKFGRKWFVSEEHLKEYFRQKDNVPEPTELNHEQEKENERA